MKSFSEALGMFFGVFSVTQNLKNMVQVVTEEDRQRELKEFEDGLSRYKELLIMISKVL